MRVFCDTSVLVAGCVVQHPHHPAAAAFLSDVLAGTLEGFCAAHSLGEAFSALTNLPLTPRISPSEAQQMIQHNILQGFTLVPAKPAFYEQAIQACAIAGALGGMVYDALLIETARSIPVDRIYTFNRRHYMQLAPDLSDQIMAP